MWDKYYSEYILIIHNFMYRMSDSTYELKENPHRCIHFKVCIMVLSDGFLNKYVAIKIC